MANDGLIRVLLVDDNTLLLYTIRTILKQYPNIEVVGEAVNGEEAVLQAEQLLPHVVVMDISMPKMNGIAATRLIRTNFPRIVVVGLTTNTEGCFVNAMSQAGAVNTLAKENAVTELHKAIQRAVASVYPMSDPWRHPSTDTAGGLVQREGYEKREANSDITCR
jgi:DNA-binding NarL/FixJ family response regulator